MELVAIKNKIKDLEQFESYCPLSKSGKRLLNELKYVLENNKTKQTAAPELLAFAIEMVKRYPNSPWINEQGQKAIDKALGNEN